MTRRVPNPKPLKVTEDQVKDAESRGLTIRQTAAMLRVNPKTVERARERAGLTHKRRGRPPVRFDPQRAERVKILLAERMPMTWIAEDVGMSVGKLRERFKPGNDPEWMSVWPLIRRNDALLALHREFAPRKGTA